jgi:hypothetical protein
MNINPHITSGTLSGTPSEMQKLQQEQLSSTQPIFLANDRQWAAAQALTVRRTSNSPGAKASPLRMAESF